MGNLFGELLARATPGAVTTTVSLIQNIAISLLAIVGVIAVGVALWIAFRLATAEDQGKRKEAKKQLLWAGIAIVGIILLMVIWFAAIHPNLAHWMRGADTGLA